MLLASNGTDRVALPSPFLFSPKTHHHSSYANPLGTNGPCLSRPLPDLGAVFPPFPFSFL